jgi:UDP-glucose 4-epimerase
MRRAQKKSTSSRGATARPTTTSVVVTGASNFLGGSILRILERHSNHRHLIAVDRRPPAFPLSRSEYMQIDLADTSSERKLASLMKECGEHTTIVHTALPWGPVKKNAYAHELMINGSLAVLRAAKIGRTRKIILASTTDIYGAFATNPNYLSEEAELRGGTQSFYLEARIYVEEMFAKYQATQKNCCVTILRPCTILGSSISNFKTNFLQQPVIPTVLGFDPLMQFVHESDVLRAFVTVIERDAPGIFNIVGDGVMPFSRATRLAHRTCVPFPEFLMKIIADISWNIDMGYAPSSHLPFLKYPCVADGEKARRELDFVPIYTSQEALLSFIGQDHNITRTI